MPQLAIKASFLLGRTNKRKLNTRARLRLLERVRARRLKKALKRRRANRDRQA